jgi:AcrR family transcriptional regulator
MDIRTKFTQKAFKDSLLELMKTTPIRDIPVKAICSEAGISRSTFYTYYNDPYDLLYEIQNETLAKFEAKFAKQIQRFDLREIRNYYEETLRYIAENNDSIRVLLSENGDPSFVKKIIEWSIVNTQIVIKHTLEESVDEKMERAYSVFLVHGGIALFQDWIKQDMDIPIPKMAKIFTKIINNIMR